MISFMTSGFTYPEEKPRDRHVTGAVGKILAYSSEDDEGFVLVEGCRLLFDGKSLDEGVRGNEGEEVEVDYFSLTGYADKLRPKTKKRGW